jgi:hypothetical protein
MSERKSSKKKRKGFKGELPKPRLKTNLLIIFVLTLLASSSIYAGNQLSKDRIVVSKDEATTEETVKASKQPQLISARSKLLFFGDTFWGRTWEQKRRANPNSQKVLDGPFSGLSTYQRENYNTWIANLECPLTDKKLDFETEKSASALNCSPAFLPSARKWFDVFSQSNNHTNDGGGRSGLESTRKALAENGFQYFGAFLSSDKEDVCEVVSVGINLTYDDGTIKQKELPIALCGQNGVFKTPTDAQLAPIKDYSKNLLTVVMPHMGVEYETTANKSQTDLYRKFIDNGADFVAGAHPHVVQNSEVYKDKLILYSMGNFIFDQRFSDDVQQSIALDVEIDVPTDSLSEFEDLLKAAEDCQPKNHKDICLAKVAELKKIPYKLKFDIVPGEQKSFVNSKSTNQAVIDKLLNRANWQDTKAQLED